MDPDGERRPPLAGPHRRCASLAGDRPRLEAALRDTEERLRALTGCALPEDRRRSAAAGFDAHLGKPAAPADAERVLATPRSAPGAPLRG